MGAWKPYNTRYWILVLAILAARSSTQILDIRPSLRGLAQGYVFEDLKIWLGKS